MSLNKTYEFSSGTLEKELDTFEEKGILQFQVRDTAITTNKQRLLKFISLAGRKAPNVLFEFEIDISIIDSDTVKAFSDIYCSLSIYVGEDCFSVPNKKLYIKKCALLNQAGLVFGFVIDCSKIKTGISLKSFKDVVDFLLQQYPNHLSLITEGVKPTATLSTQDIETLKNFAFATEVFYTSGRAVPWFLAVVAPLKLRPSVFLKDFSEWQMCNNCGLKENSKVTIDAKDSTKLKDSKAIKTVPSNFNIETATHVEIEKMQLLFIKMKYEEKHIHHIFPAAEDLVLLHGAFSRAVAENEETVLDLSYEPEDLFSPYAQDLVMFSEEACMVACTIDVFCGDEGPDYRVKR